MSEIKKNRGTVWVFVLVTVIAVVALVLSLIALKQGKTNPAEQPEYSFTPDPNIETGNDNGLDASGDETVAPTSPAEPIILQYPNRYLLLTESKTIMRGKFGECPVTAPTLETTSFSNIDWLSNDLGVVTEIFGVYSGPGDLVQFTVLNEECNPVLIQTFTAGAAWDAVDFPIDQLWFFDRSTPEIIHTPLGPLSAPCDVIQMSVADEQTALLCQDSTVAVSSDLGATWSASVQIPGVQSIAATNDDVLALTANAENCAGIEVVKVENTAAGSAGECKAAQNIEAGEIAIAASASGVVVWVGDDLFMSTDRGQTWL